VLMTLEGTLNPMRQFPAYAEIKDLPFDQQRAMLLDPAFRAKVLADDALLSRFGIAEKWWGRIKQSFKTQPYAISGRFDFVIDATGTQLKMFEYNADSASTLLECGVIQQKWAAKVGLDLKATRSSGEKLTQLLQRAWADATNGGQVPSGSTVHFLVDDDDEEKYTALLVMEAAEAAGLKTKLHVLFDDFEWRGGKVCDKASGEALKTVWKTWAWETAITDDEKCCREYADGNRPTTKPDGSAVRLCEILLGDPSIHVFEPMWKLIPSNKAILPVFSELYPDHPNLLRTEWSVTPELQKSGYAKKPIVGRQGKNVTVVGPGGKTVHATVGQFADRDHVYQELFQLPKRDDYYAILGGWMIGPHYAGTGLREDKTVITGVESPYSAIRVQIPSA